MRLLNATNNKRMLSIASAFAWGILMQIKNG